MNQQPKDQNRFKILGILISLGFLLVTYNQCILDTKTNAPRRPTSTLSDNSTTLPENDSYSDDQYWNDHGGDDSYVDEGDSQLPPAMAEGERLREEPVDYGVKNFEQINLTMSLITGIPHTAPEIVSVYNDLKEQLPTTNDIKSFSSTHQVSITKLAVEYCDLAVRRTDVRSRLWPNINFGRGPNTELGATGQEYLVNRTVDAFYGEGVLDRNLEVAIEFELRILVSDLLQGESQTASGTTQMVTKGVCTAVLSALPLYLH